MITDTDDIDLIQFDMVIGLKLSMMLILMIQIEMNLNRIE